MLMGVSGYVEFLVKWEFLVMLVAITDIYYSMFILLALLMIKNSLFVVITCSSWENIDIGIDIEKKWQISRKYRIA
jgi:hypothetical protein